MDDDVFQWLRGVASGSRASPMLITTNGIARRHERAGHAERLRTCLAQPVPQAVTAHLADDRAARIASVILGRLPRSDDGDWIRRCWGC